MPGPSPMAYNPTKPKSPLNSVKKASSKGDKRETIVESWNEWWLSEFGACLLSLIFFFGTFGVMKKYDHQRLADWPYSLTINTVISILSTGLGGTLLVPISEGLSQLKWVWFTQPRIIADMETFDDASRGILGALNMLYTLRGLHLATFGSLITILSLTLSPFLQQVITFPIHETTMSFNSSIPRTNSFNDQPAPIPEMGLSNTTMQGAIFNGIFNPDQTALRVQPSCSTGNCTFSKPYSSLAMCSSCTNITQSIKKTVYFSSSSQNVTIGGQYYSNYTFNHYNYSLPNGLSIADQGGIYINTAGSADASNTVYSEFSNPLSVVSVISSTNNPFLSPVYFPITGPWAAQCVLYFCVNTYNATVRNGILKETIVSTFTNESASLTSINDEQVFGPLTQQPCLKNSTNEWRCSGCTANQTSDSCDYDTDWQTYLVLRQWLPSIFISTTTNSINFPNVVWNNNQSSFEFINTLMSNVATSMTTNIRSFNVGPAALGTVSSLETYIEVQWGWMILPACLVFFSILFLVATVLQSRGIGAWKSSPLPLVVTSRIADPADRMEDLHDIEWVAKSRYAVLKKMPDGNVVFSREID